MSVDTIAMIPIPASLVDADESASLPKTNGSISNKAKSQIDRLVKDARYCHNIQKKAFSEYLKKVLNVINPQKSNKKRYPNGYIIYSKENREKVVRENPELKSTEIITELGKRWRALTKEEQNEYIVRAEQAKPAKTSSSSTTNANGAAANHDADESSNQEDEEEDELEQQQQPVAKARKRSTKTNENGETKKRGRKAGSTSKKSKNSNSNNASL